MRACISFFVPFPALQKRQRNAATTDGTHITPGGHLHTIREAKRHRRRAQKRNAPGFHARIVYATFPCCISGPQFPFCVSLCPPLSLFSSPLFSPLLFTSTMNAARRVSGAAVRQAAAVQKRTSVIGPSLEQRYKEMNHAKCKSPFPFFYYLSLRSVLWRRRKRGPPARSQQCGRG